MCKIIMGKGANVPIYIAPFRKALHDVLEKIKECDDEITWIVCGEEYLPSKDSLKERVTKGQKIFEIHKYGCCVCCEEKVWISTQAILESGMAIETMVAKSNKFLGLNNAPKIDTLTAVILDELAHIKTGCDHGDAKYEARLKKYKERYLDK